MVIAAVGAEARALLELRSQTTALFAFNLRSRDRAQTKVVKNRRRRALS